MTTETIELSAGTIDYQDTGGDGPVVVLLHGLLMDATLWDAVTGELRAGHRVVAPTLPMGAHARPMRDDADLSPRALARLVGSSWSASTCGTSRWWATTPVVRWCSC